MPQEMSTRNYWDPEYTFKLAINPKRGRRQIEGNENIQQAIADNKEGKVLQWTDCGEFKSADGKSYNISICKGLVRVERCLDKVVIFAVMNFVNGNDFGVLDNETARSVFKRSMVGQELIYISKK
jgi:hypothetical protein